MAIRRNSVGVSKQDWKDWYDNKWAGSGGCVEKCQAAMAAFDSTVDSLNGNEPEKFLSLTGGEADDGLHKTTIAASWAVSEAEEELKRLELKGNQRRFANATAIDANDLAINKVNQCTYALSLVDTDLVRGVKPEHDAVQSDPSAMTGIKDDLVGRLRATKSRIEGSLGEADQAAKYLVSITQIGRF
jgi:hypothetical protein